MANISIFFTFSHFALEKTKKIMYNV